MHSQVLWIRRLKAIRGILLSSCPAIRMKHPCAKRAPMSHQRAWKTPAASVSTTAGSSGRSSLLLFSSISECGTSRDAALRTILASLREIPRDEKDVANLHGLCGGVLHLGSEFRM